MMSWQNIQAQLDADINREESLKAKSKKKPNIALIESLGKIHRLMMELMGKSYDEIQELFDKEMKRVNTFMAMSLEAQESNEKKVEGSEEKAKSSKKTSLGLNTCFAQVCYDQRSYSLASTDLGMDDLARTFKSLLVAEVGKRNLNPNIQMRQIEQLRQ
ncbi:hypothetical protein Tco_0824125 [Tanacetum coccineum]|uniref:Uncharacterized protein n=1 Tax=Tanacetum coccineum TaxID=301880 RepID=A0ABQ5ANX2_9ASTR